MLGAPNKRAVVSAICCNGARYVARCVGDGAQDFGARLLLHPRRFQLLSSRTFSDAGEGFCFRDVNLVGIGLRDPIPEAFGAPDLRACGPSRPVALPWPRRVFVGGLAPRLGDLPRFMTSRVIRRPYYGARKTARCPAACSILARLPAFCRYGKFELLVG